jgi:alkylation response protein AidB-like acyl-CoA dehydrogenase
MEAMQEFRERARTWIRTNLAPADRELGHQRGVDETPERIAQQRRLQRRLLDAGFAGIAVPPEYGGQGLTEKHEQIFHMESGDYQTPNFGILSLVTFGIVLPTILATCSESFKRRHVPAILAGDELWCQLLSEPGAGSDLGGILTRAERDGDNWVVNGAKIWSSGAMFADYGLCITRTNWDASKYRGLTWFAMPLRNGAVTVRPIREINGGQEFCEAFLDGVRLTDDEVMGEVDAGWSLTQSMLVFERGAGRGARVEIPIDPAPDLVRLASDRGLLHDSYVRQQIASAYVYDVVKAALTQRADRAARTGDNASMLASYLKLAKGVFGPMRAKIGMEIAGSAAIASAGAAGAGLDYLNCRVQSIAGGSNEMQRNAISEKALGLPKEPSVDRDKPFRQVLEDARRWGRT